LAGVGGEACFIAVEVCKEAGKVDCLEHEHIPHNLACQEHSLHLFVWDEVVEPVLAEFRDADCGEEMR